MIHHYLTFYVENDIRYAEAWIQINILGLCFCLWKIKKEIKSVSAKWVLKTFDDGYGEYQLYECDQCGAVTAQSKSKNYCHNCGAKMESEE